MKKGEWELHSIFHSREKNAGFGYVNSEQSHMDKTNVFGPKWQ